MLFEGLNDKSRADDTEKLLKYRRVMLWVVRLCFYSAVCMVSGVALGLTFGFQIVELVILGVSCAISLALIVPSLFCVVWIDGIEKKLHCRQVSLDCSIEKRVRGWALKMMLWAILVVLLPILVRNFIWQR